MGSQAVDCHKQDRDQQLLTNIVRRPEITPGRAFHNLWLLEAVVFTAEVMVFTTEVVVFTTNYWITSTLPPAASILA
jgi:hypothetical protein